MGLTRNVAPCNVTALSTGLLAISVSVVSAVPDSVVTGFFPKFSKPPKEVARRKLSASASHRRYVLCPELQYSELQVCAQSVCSRYSLPTCAPTHASVVAATFLRISDSSRSDLGSTRRPPRKKHRSRASRKGMAGIATLGSGQPS